MEGGNWVGEKMGREIRGEIGERARKVNGNWGWGGGISKACWRTGMEKTPRSVGVRG